MTSAGAIIFFSGWHGKLFAGAAQGRYFQVFLCPRRLPLVPVLPSAKFSDAKLILSLIQIPSSCNLSHSTQNIEQDHIADLLSTIWSSWLYNCHISNPWGHFLAKAEFALEFGQIFQMFLRLGSKHCRIFVLIAFTFTYFYKAEQGKLGLLQVRCENKIIQDSRLTRYSSWINW